MVTKVLISETFISPHFMDRVSQRLPKSFYSNFALKSAFNDSINNIRDITFPNGRFAVNILKLNKYYICGVIDNNDFKTIFLRPTINIANTLPIYDVNKFKSELQFIESANFPLGKYLYQYVDESTPFYFIVKDKKILGVTVDRNKPELKNYQIYNID